jgi:hypothetical protein
MNNLPVAEEFFLSAYRKNPTDPHLLNEMAVLHYEKGE